MEITVSGKGQIVIPAQLREKFEIKKGTKLTIEAENGSIRLKPKASITTLCGTWKLDMRQMRARIRRERAQWR